ncbi:MAG: hypothetical protein ACI9F9_001019 [Candidatus Paceibacteria bacterium]|jgi:hypothetical protein
MSLIDAPAFAEHFLQALDGLRGSLTELYCAVGADPEDPQTVSRQFGLHRNLAWKLTRIMHAPDAEGVLPYLPGSAGFVLALKAFKKAGAPQPELDAFERAKNDFESMIDVHAGNRATLELMLDSSGLGIQGDPLEASRKLAFRGNSGIWGIQARTRLRTAFLAPNPESPDMLDLAHLSGLIDLRRFRPNATWPLFHRNSFNDDMSPRETVSEPIDTHLGELADTRLWPEFCTKPLPEVRAIPTRLGARYEVVGDQVGNRGLSTCVHGDVTRRFATRYADDKNTRGEFYADINAPTENLVFDLILHKDLAAEIDPKVEVLLVDGRESGQRSGAPIPCSETLRRMGSVPPRVATPLVPRYSQIVEAVYERMNWKAQDFFALRFEMKCPPLPSSVLIRYDLPQRP